MIKLSLPYIYNNDDFYRNLIIQSKNENFFKDIKFYAYGNLPWAYWHGGKSTNINTKEVVLNENINSFLNNFSLPFFFDVSNLNLNEKDLNDRKLNTILSTMHNGSSKIICSDIELAFKLKEKYPYYNFIFSDNACLKLPFTSEIINIILDEKFFEGIIINPNLIDLNFEFN